MKRSVPRDRMAGRNADREAYRTAAKRRKRAEAAAAARELEEVRTEQARLKAEAAQRRATP